jgi:hypothetical protein
VDVLFTQQLAELFDHVLYCLIGSSNICSAKNTVWSTANLFALSWTIFTPIALFAQ